MQAKLSRKICDRARAQYSRVFRAPRPVRFEVFAMAPVRVIDSPMQHELLCSPLNPVQRNFAQHQDRIVIQVLESRWIKIVKQTRRIVIPAPPQIPSQRPQSLERRSDESIERARFTHDGGHLGCRFYEHSNFIVMKYSRFLRLNHKDALQHATIDERNTQERV